MARFIASYTNDSAIQEAVDNKTLGKPYVALNDQTGKIDWNGKDIDYSKMYLTIEALSGGTFYVRKDGFDYSVNGGEWLKTSVSNPISLQTGDKVRVKSKHSSVVDYLFSGNTMSFNVYGNIESLGYGDDFLSHTETFSTTHLFEGSSGLLDASNLVMPSMNIIGGAYQYMFNNCTSLTKAPKLPATTLANLCYAQMFQNCTSLTKAPELPATTIASRCYWQMFAGCSSLTTPPALPATTLYDYCYCEMFANCTNLTTSPDLYAATLTSNCYNGMFYNCRPLNHVKCLSTDISADSCTSIWLRNVSTTGTFVKKAGVTWPTGTSGIPDGWTVIEE